MATLVDHKAANFTLESLLAKAPDKILAVTAEGGLLEEAWNELMVLHFVNIFLSQGSPSVDTEC